MVDVHTQEQHVLYVSRWLSVDEDDHQIIRELPLHRSPPAVTLPGTTNSRMLWYHCSLEHIVSCC